MRILSLFFFWTCLFAEEKFVIGSFRNEGFFSSFLAVLSNVMWAERNGKIPVVHWTQECFYYQKEGYHGSMEPWEYYFEPISHLRYEPGDPTYNSGDALDGTHVWGPFLKYSDHFHREFRFQVHDVIQRYIQIKPHILEKVDAFYNTHMKGKRTIGIHLRGTDRNIKTKKDGMIEALLEAAENVADKECQFFIATDEESLLDYAKGHVQHPLLYHNSHRSTDGVPLHIGNFREECPALLGEEVLIEALLLSKCDFFVHSLSSVAVAVLYFNPSIPSIYKNPLTWIKFN